MTLLQHLSSHAALAVPSPLAGEGQGEGYPTTRSLRSTSDNRCFQQTLFPEPPLSPALPRRGGGSYRCTPPQRSAHRMQPLRAPA
ncbi:hypothetical protein ABIE49_004207 [Bradyrhizobium sp. OAE829]